MNKEECVGEFGLHKNCSRCQIQATCRRKQAKLLIILKEKLEKELPLRTQAKDYKELQIMEEKRQKAINLIKKYNTLARETRQLKYNSTKSVHELLGIKIE